MSTYGDLCGLVNSLCPAPATWTEEELRLMRDLEGQGEGLAMLQAYSCRGERAAPVEDDVGKCSVGAVRETLWGMLGLDARGREGVVDKKRRQAEEDRLKGVTCPILMVGGEGEGDSVCDEESGDDGEGRDAWVVSVEVVGRIEESSETTTDKSEQKARPGRRRKEQTLLKKSLSHCVSVSQSHVSGAPYSACIWTHPQECAGLIDEWIDCE